MTAFFNSAGKIEILLLCLFFGLGFLGKMPSLQAQEKSQSGGALQNLSSRIASQRAQLESLSDQLAREKAQYDEQLRSLAVQMADVEALLNRERLQLTQVESDIEKVRAEINRAQEDFVDLKPLVDSGLVQLESYIKEGLPFQREQRLATLETIDRLRTDGSMDDKTALTRLWNLVDSEFRLVSDSGLYRQVIMVDGEEKLAEVARLGMVLIYFRTMDGDLGYVTPGDGEDHFKILQDNESRQQIQNLFDALKRNLRRGFFLLPNPLSDSLEG